MTFLLAFGYSRNIPFLRTATLVVKIKYGLAMQDRIAFKKLMKSVLNRVVENKLSQLEVCVLTKVLIAGFFTKMPFFLHLSFNS